MAVRYRNRNKGNLSFMTLVCIVLPKPVKELSETCVSMTRDLNVYVREKMSKLKEKKLRSIDCLHLEVVGWANNFLP